MITLTITEQDEGVKQLLSEFAKRVEDPTPAMRSIAQTLRDSSMLDFRSATGPDGVAWKPSRRALREGGITLTDRGILKGSVHSEASRDRAVVGTADVRAAVLHFGAARGSLGTRRVRVKSHLRGSWNGGIPVYVRAHVRIVSLPWGNIPPRPFLGATEDDIEEIKDILTRYITRNAQ